MKHEWKWLQCELSLCDIRSRVPERQTLSSNYIIVSRYQLTKVHVVSEHVTIFVYVSVMVSRYGTIWERSINTNAIKTDVAADACPLPTEPWISCMKTAWCHTTTTTKSRREINTESFEKTWWWCSSSRIAEQCTLVHCTVYAHWM